eukprot:CAMPEP_0206630136 /NCGR_PEP_ID=MMETSP0325_2-20121206/67406_1 /ASSEMBLY_ACC=CAM_ASM_000347 /TAXON_ID=2866 /ORGANISM="Crypthecodinium cohnii, Strain Seligo" /LENGTH=112 /DNA_ID=CAMNT_0054154963 /DNA_START=459 /DNA_END=797 /DNA_ORIENTATION=+
MTQPTLKSNPYTQIPEANAATVIHAQRAMENIWKDTAYSCHTASRLGNQDESLRTNFMMHVQNKPWDPTPEAKKYPNTNSAGTPALYSPMQTSKIIPIMGKVMVKYTENGIC